jgi:hypothetical protein
MRKSRESVERSEKREKAAMAQLSPTPHSSSLTSGPIP